MITLQCHSFRHHADREPLYPGTTLPVVQMSLLPLQQLLYRFLLFTHCKPVHSRCLFWHDCNCQDVTANIVLAIPWHPLSLVNVLLLCFCLRGLCCCIYSSMSSSSMSRAFWPLCLGRLFSAPPPFAASGARCTA